jgi:hypothetical protein
MLPLAAAFGCLAMFWLAKIFSLGLAKFWIGEVLVWRT